MSIVLYLLAGIILLGSLYKFWFLRNPKRKITSGNNVVSPADGKIVKIIEFNYKNDSPVAGEFEIQENKLGKVLVKTKDVAEKGWLIVIAMNIHNMHRQKAPLEGEVISIKYSKGRFFNAVRKAHDLRAALENESNEILLKTAIGKIKVIQVAGVLAKKIVCFVKEGQAVAKGDNLGLIKLGSQVILVLPDSTGASLGGTKNKLILKIKEKNKVKAGISIIAEISEPAEDILFGW